MNRPILLAAGGTAGHVMPALALAEAFTEQGFAVAFTGRASGIEADLVKGKLPYHALSSRGIPREFSFKVPAALFSLLRGTVQAAALLKRVRPLAVIGCGGYAAAPVLAAARLLGYPTALLEADSHMGLANRALAPWVDRLFLAFPLPHFQDKSMVCGRPLSRAFQAVTRSQGQAHFNLRSNLPVVCVVGGSLGALSLNEAAFTAFSTTSHLQVIHVTGRRDYPDFKARLEALPPNPYYQMLEYTSDLPLALAASDLVVSRAGGSVAEITALGKPSLLVPYPFATANHQFKNARHLAKAGAARIILDSELSGEGLAKLVSELLGTSRLAHMASAARAYGRPRATECVVREVMTLISKENRR